MGTDETQIVAVHPAKKSTPGGRGLDWVRLVLTGFDQVWRDILSETVGSHISQTISPPKIKTFFSQKPLISLDQVGLGWIKVDCTFCHLKCRQVRHLCKITSPRYTPTSRSG